MLEPAEIYIIGGMYQSNNYVQRLAVSSTGIEHLKDGPQVPVDSLYAASAVVDDSQTLITLIGGEATITENVIYMYNLVWHLNILETNSPSYSWTRGPNLITGRYYHCSCKLAAFIYVVGGTDEQLNYLSSVEVLDTSQRSPEWTLIKPYPIKVTNPACVMMGDEIWVSGGSLTATDHTSAVYSWNTTTWQTRSKMTYKRSGHSMMAYNGQIWVIFGDDTSSVEVYKNNKWTILLPLFMQQRNGPSVFWGNTVIHIAVIVAGGFIPQRTSNEVFTMNTTTGIWSLSPTSLRLPVTQCAAVLVTP